jgi:hypothetical protein
LTSNGTIEVTGAGTSSQFVKGDGSLDSTAYGTGSVTSVGLTMPSAFNVGSSPITTNGTIAVTGAGTTAQYVRGDGSLATFPGLTGFVPYTGATADVNLGTHDLTAERGTFENNGSSDTLTVNHTSGSGYGIEVTKGGNNEALYVNKTSGSGNAMAVVGGRTSLVDLSLSSVSNATGNFLTISGGVVHQRTASETRSDVGAQAQLNGTGFVKASGTTITYDNSTYQVTSEKAQPNGYASLDSNGKVPLVQINDALIGNVNFQGLWNASTNTPTLANPPSSGTKGYYYIVSTAGTFASISFEVGDWIISNGTAWGKVDNTDAVSSVFGRTGNVTATNGDYNTSQVTENTNLYYTEARVSANTDVAANTAARHNAVTLGTANGLSLSTQVLSLQLATSGQNGALSSTDWTTFNNKENAITSGTTAQYFRGDKTFQTLNTGVVPESGNLYFTNARAIASVLTGYSSGAGTISAADTILSAIQKLNGNIGALTTGVSSVNGQTGVVVLTTTNIAEGTNLYYTEARVNANTNVAANTAARHAAVTLGTANGLSLNVQQLSLGLASAGVTGALSGTDWSTFNSKENSITAGTTSQYFRGDKTFQTLNTAAVPESVNLYYTDARSRAALSFVAGSGAYNSTTGVITIPTNNNQITNGAGYITSASTITGASGALTSRDNRTISPSEDNAGQLKFGFTSWANNDSAPYGDYLHLRSYTDSTGGDDNLVMFLKSGIGMRIYQQSFGSATPYSSFKDIAFTDGTNASGTWGIAISGNAATANTWTTARTLTIGATGKSVDGSSNVAWSLSEIGAYAATNPSAFIALTALSGTAPIQYNNTTGAISITQASGSTNGFLSSTDWNTFNNKTSNVGTVTSVAALTLGTSGTDLSSTVANGTTTPVITLNVPTASASNRGALSAADWTTFNSKENSITAGTTAQYYRGDKTFQTLNTSVVPELTNLYYTEARVNANTNVAANTAARHNAVTLGTANGLSLSTQQLSLGLASSSANGALSSTDWTTFNNKQNALTNPVTGTGTTNYLPKFTGASTIGNSIVFDNGTNVGIGNATPSDSYSFGRALDINGSNGAALYLRYSTDPTVQFGMIGYDRTGLGMLIATNNSLPIIFSTNTSTKMTLSASGNLGLGVTPSAWGSGYRALQVGPTSALFEVSSLTILSNNQYYNGGDLYLTSDFASRYVQYDGMHIWATAPSGTAGNAISFTQAMTLGSNSGLSIGTPAAAPSQGLLVQGEGRFNTGLNVNSTGTEMVNINVVDSSGRQGIRLNNGINNSGAIVVFNSASSTGTETGGLLRIHQTSSSLSQPSAVFRQDGSADILQLQGASGALRFNIASSGAATFSSSVTANTFVEIVGDLRFNSNSADRTIFFRGSAGSPDTNWKMGNYLNPTGATTVNLAATVIDVFGGAAGYGFMVRNTSNASLLEIAGNTGAATFSSSVTALTNLAFINTNASQAGFVADYTGTGALKISFSTYNDTMAIYNETNGYAIVNFVRSTKNLIFNPTGGNVLIGTTSDVGGRFGIKSSGTNTAPLVIQRSANTNTLCSILETSTGDASMTLSSALGESSIQLLSNGNSTFRGGNVLIGTSADLDDLLRVNGNTYTNTIRTYTPDLETRSVAWKLGASRGGTVTTNATVRVEIDGVLVDLVARYV